MYFIILCVCFFASIVGAICGIGGGVIIKPVLDALGILEVSAINFLSGCTVLAMTTYSVAKCKWGGSSCVQKRTGVPLAMGAAIGGILGKWIFQWILSNSSQKESVQVLQAVCLLIVTIGTLVYTLLKKNIITHRIQNIVVVMGIGLILGVLSSFLGIGGGPINLIFLFYFFSMQTKEAAENSLYIIFYSQAASLLQSAVTRSIPDIKVSLLILMIVGGISGAIAGRYINSKIDNRKVEKLFIMLMILMIGINIYNIIKFSI